MFQEDDAYESALGLGELAELTDYSAINNETEVTYDVSDYVLMYEYLVHMLFHCCTPPSQGGTR